MPFLPFPRRHFRRLSHLRPLIVAMLCGITCTSGDACTTKISCRIAFQEHGRLTVQSAAGGKAAPATPAETAAWRASSSQRSAKFRLSPDGRLRVEPYRDPDRGTSLFRVVRAAGGTKVADSYLYGSEGTGRQYFGGWLPDSHHILVWTSSPIAGQDTRTLAAVDVETGQRTAFNGWAAASSGNSGVSSASAAAISVAIVPGREGEVGEQEWRVEAGKPWHESPRVAFFVAAGPLPSDASGLAHYRAARSHRLPLTYQGKPFAGLQRLLPAWDEAAVPDVPPVEFSADRKWALLHATEYGSGGPRKTDYLADLGTGRVRRLDGASAAFLP